MNKEQFLTQFFLQLNESNIEYFVFGEYSELPKSTGNSDLDIIVTPKDIKSLLTNFNNLIVKHKIKLVSFYTNNNGFFYRIINDKDQSWGLQLDLFYKGFYFQNKEYFPVEEIKNDILLYQGIKVLNINKTYLIGFLKEIVHNSWSKDKYINGFLDEVLRDEKKHQLLFLRLYGKEFVDLVFSGLSEKALKLNSERLGKIIFQKIYGGSFSKLINKLDKISYFKRLFRMPGYTIAFLGTDGSGKSTIIDAITPILNEGFNKSVYYEHMRPNKLPSIARLLGKKEDSSSPVTDPHAQKQSGFVGSLFRFSYYYIDYTLGYFLKIFPKKAFKSCIWIFDRYYYDYLLDQKRARIKLPVFVIKIGAFFMPKPDMIICLGTDAEKIYARKPEISFQEVERQVKALKDFSSQNKGAVWIDTGVDIETSKQACLEHITNFMVNRFKDSNQ